MNTSLFNGLNKEQKEAVEQISGPSIILAGAGSGKTRVLVYKVLNLIINHNISPWSIVMITFTNKAANEMKERILNSLPATAKNLGFVGTFHSFCARILRINGERIGIDKNFIIYDESDQLAFIKSIIKDDDKTNFNPSYYLNRISSAKNELISPEKYLKIFSDHFSLEVSKVYQKYQKGLKKNKALDFDDLLVKTIELFMQDSEILNKYQEIYQYLLVDEFQDTNFAQYQLAKLIANKHKNITVVGDFSQSIYSWRGADIANLEKFQKNFPNPKIFYLETNYRSSQNILDFAYKIISKNTTHPILHLMTKNQQGEEVIFFEADNEQDETIFVSQEIERVKDKIGYSSIAVLYRTNAQSRIMEEALLHFAIPYILVGGTRFYERTEVKDVLSYLRLLINPQDEISLNRIKKIGKKRFEEFKNFYKKASENMRQQDTNDLIEQVFHSTKYLELYNPTNEEDYARLENIKELKSVAIKFPKIDEFLEQVALVESEYSEDEKRHKSDEGVKLMTLHQAKGLEFDVVFIIGVEEGILPHSRSIEDQFQLEEERRLFYVGITRARQKLYITYTKKRFIFGRRNYALKSRFIMDDDDLIQFG